MSKETFPKTDGKQCCICFGVAIGQHPRYGWLCDPCYRAVGKLHAKPLFQNLMGAIRPDDEGEEWKREKR